MLGEVKVVNVSRGFGFISGEDRRDYFFHFNMVLKGTISPHRLLAGDNVEFQVVENEDLKRNPQAINVKFLNGSNSQAGFKLSDIVKIEGEVKPE